MSFNDASTSKNTRSKCISCTSSSCRNNTSSSSWSNRQGEAVITGVELWYSKVVVLVEYFFIFMNASRVFSWTDSGFTRPREAMRQIHVDHMQATDLSCSPFLFPRCTCFSFPCTCCMKSLPQCAFIDRWGCDAGFLVPRLRFWMVLDMVCPLLLYQILAESSASPAGVKASGCPSGALLCQE